MLGLLLKVKLYKLNEICYVLYTSTKIILPFRTRKPTCLSMLIFLCTFRPWITYRCNIVDLQSKRNVETVISIFSFLFFIQLFIFLDNSNKLLQIKILIYFLLSEIVLALQQWDIPIIISTEFLENKLQNRSYIVN